MANKEEEVKNMTQNITNLKDSLFAKLVNFDVSEHTDTLCVICADDGEPQEATHDAYGIEVCVDCYMDGCD